MASSFSTNLKLELMTTGEKSGTWGTITNTNLQQLEQAASGYISVDVAAGDVALAYTKVKAALFTLTTKLEAAPNILDPFLAIVKLLELKLLPLSIK